ncbi:hypothetical protein VP1G_10599 [Cytospora mali]|uniref:Uncharacterized protein n=1 Tax=Cytospora mali TaxID=578113 RepID=A0A194UPG7_CYTMA|nr:hypothetical protein VP1G_10599 [Valsa mali var. pyri (nom. inval.)]
MSIKGILNVDRSVDTAPAVSPEDGLADMFLGLVWLGTFYVIGIIWTSLAFIDRWRGPHGTGNITYVSVLSALGLGAAWPVVLVIGIFR